jgi:hypothetical protein
MKSAVDCTRGMCRKTVMLRTVWAKIESRRRLFLIDERCDFIERVKLYLDHLAHDGRHGTSHPLMEAENTQ